MLSLVNAIFSSVATTQWLEWPIDSQEPEHYSASKWGLIKWNIFFAYPFPIHIEASHNNVSFPSRDRLMKSWLTAAHLLITPSLSYSVTTAPKILTFKWLLKVRFSNFFSQTTDQTWATLTASALQILQVRMNTIHSKRYSLIGCFDDEGGEHSLTCHFKFFSPCEGHRIWLKWILRPPKKNNSISPKRHMFMFSSGCRNCDYCSSGAKEEITLP